MKFVYTSCLFVKFIIKFEALSCFFRQIWNPKICLSFACTSPLDSGNKN